MSTSAHFDQTGLLPHGGRLKAAATHFSIPLEQWLDLSTGINTNGWPAKDLPASVWIRLPENDDGLDAVAGRYYGADYLLPVAGSQAAIQALPHLRAFSRVSVLHPGYAEHVHAWRRNHHAVSVVTLEQIDEALPNTDVLILIHPNNPTGAVFSVAKLLDWHAQLTERHGWLIVDEAFMDATPEFSLSAHASKPGLIVLRSLGKFFGLAGARIGFVCAQPELLKQLHHLLGPWTVNTPGRWVAIQALQDVAWQEKTRSDLLDACKRLHAMLTKQHLPPAGGCAFFQWVVTRHANDLYAALASQGILVRYINDPPSLRFGLPAQEPDWQRLEHALTRIQHQFLNLAEYTR